MTSKERVLNVFTGEILDRVPLNYFANPKIHEKLLKHITLNQGDDKSLLKIFNIDFRGIEDTFWRLHTGFRITPPVENVIAMYETAKTFGIYSLN